jgi:hypothetical protein
MLPLFGNRQPISVLHTEYNEWCGTLSPDNRWIAYASDESGRSEIYVRAFSQEGTGSERKWLVSGNGGYWPKWRRDGKELLYLDADRGIVGVQVAAGASFQHATPQPLFASGIRTPEGASSVLCKRRFLPWVFSLRRRLIWTVEKWESWFWISTFPRPTVNSSFWSFRLS